MKIEQEIKQKRPFRNSYHKAAVNLIFTNNWLCDKIKKRLKPYGLTLQQYNMLRILRGAAKPLSTSCIRERMVDKMSDTSRMVERLCQKEWVERNACCNDRRKVDVTISPKGLDLILEVESNDVQLEDDMSKLSEDEANQLSNLLDKLRD